MRNHLLFAGVWLLVLPPSADAGTHKPYRWQRRQSDIEPLSRRVAPPKGFSRSSVKAGSYASWLRQLPLLPRQSPVRSYRGRLILPAKHPALLAVIDIDVGKRDRQHCVDAIMRLRGEYLWSVGKGGRVGFAWAGGRRFGFKAWKRGLRPVKQGRRWEFVAKSKPSRGYRSFRRYLGFMFSWTGTMHQRGERRVRPEQLQGGDFFVQGGSPGHAVIVLDLATDGAGRRVALLAQSYMPAQDVHVLRGPQQGWFPLEAGKTIKTPLWPSVFSWKDLRRFRDAR
ncbi:MAG: hypothetical protein JRH20_27955 [Deltaproteobacteria bacterium]|nr:hypothetical protein [Deltaproteobacteria bacterium]